MPNEYDTPFGQFYRSLLYGEAVQLARKAGTSGQYLWSIASGRRKPGVQICARLMAADDRITLAMLRPDHFED